MHLRNTGVGIRIASSLEVYLLGTFLLVLPTSLPHHLSSLSEAVTSVVLFLSIDPFKIQNVVGILSSIYCFTSLQRLWPPPLIFHFLF